MALSMRWWWFLRSLGGHVPFWQIARYRLTAFGITYFTPGPQFGGEPYQVIALRAGNAVPLPVALSSVALDKLVELIANFSFLFFGLLLIVQTGLVPGLDGWSTLPLILVVLSLPTGYLFLIWRDRLPASAILRKLWRFVPVWIRKRKVANRSWRDAFEALAEAEGRLAQLCREQPAAVALGLAGSAAIWLALIAEYHLALSFLGLDLPLGRTIVALTAARVAFLLPLPAGLGTLEASQVLAMQALGWSAAFGVSISLLIRLRDLFFAGLGLWLSGLGQPLRWKPLLRE